MSDTEEISFPTRRIGKYELRAAIGGGGMGRVYRAQLHGPARATREVAIKVLHSHLSEEREFILMFLDEMRLAMALSHRNIVQTFDAGSVDGRYYMVMELVEGFSLRGLLGRIPRPARLPIDIALFIGMEVCAALDYAHQFHPPGDKHPIGLIHRDVSPSNILLSRQGDVKLTDFGVAKAAGRLSVSTVDSVKGKLAYMAPEQARGKGDASSDLFALGAVIYELLSGHPIRRNRDLSAVREGAPVPAILRAQRPEIPESLERLIMSCLATRVQDRPASAGELREALAQERFSLELVQPMGLDAHARLRRYLAETAPAREAAPPSSGGRLAEQLLRQAQEPESVSSEPPTETHGSESLGASGDSTQPSLGTVTTEESADELQGLSGLPTLIVTEPEPERPTRVSPAGEVRPRVPRPVSRTRTLLLGVGAVLAVGLSIALTMRATRPNAGLPAASVVDAAARAWVNADAPSSSPDRGVQPDLSRGVQTRDIGAGSAAERRPRPHSLGRPRGEPRSKVEAGGAPGAVWVMTRSGGRLQWATVLLDGREIGQSPIRVPQVTPGEHRIEIRRKGYRSESRKVIVEPGGMLRVFFELSAAP